MNRTRRMPLPSHNFLTILFIMAVSGGVAFFNVIDSNLTVFVFVAAGWVASVCIHEFGHAYAAKRGGDYSIDQKGYLELDPAHFMEPVGSILFPLLMLALGGIGMERSYSSLPVEVVDADLTARTYAVGRTRRADT